jgi:hypothetical protein
MIVNMFAVVGIGAKVWAHPEFNPVTTNKYVKVDLLTGHELRLAYTVMYGDAPAAAARKEGDANSDGRIDDAEAKAMGEALLRRVQAAVTLTIDGKPVALAFEAPQVGLMGAEVAPAPFSVDLTARVQAPGAGPHQAVFDDHLEPPTLGETEIKIVESPQTRLTAAWRGAAGSGREPRHVFRGTRRTSLEDRSITFSWEGTTPVAPPVGSRTAAWPLLAGAAVLVAAVVGFVLYRRMKG